MEHLRDDVAQQGTVSARALERRAAFDMGQSQLDLLGRQWWRLYGIGRAFHGAEFAPNSARE